MQHCFYVSAKAIIIKKKWWAEKAKRRWDQRRAEQIHVEEERRRNRNRKCKSSTSSHSQKPFILYTSCFLILILILAFIFSLHTVHFLFSSLHFPLFFVCILKCYRRSFWRILFHFIGIYYMAGLMIQTQTLWRVGKDEEGVLLYPILCAIHKINGLFYTIFTKRCL